MQNELQHHGVKGQKWGVRRERDTSGNKRSANKTRQEELDRIRKEEAQRAKEQLAAERKKKTKKIIERAATIGAVAAGVLITTGAAWMAKREFEPLFKDDSYTHRE